MSHHRTQDSVSGTQVEIHERPYRNHHERAVVEVTAWRSLDESRTFVFEEVDPARRQLEFVGTLLGDQPRVVVSALEDLGYEVSI